MKFNKYGEFIFAIGGDDHNKNEYYHYDFRDTGINNLVEKILSKLNLEVNSIHAPFLNNLDISHIDEGLRSFTVKEICLSIDALHNFGGNTIILHPTACPLCTNDEKYLRFNQIKKSITEIYNYSIKKSVVIAIETMPATQFVGNYETFDEMFDIIDNKDIKICVDTSHVWLWQKNSVDFWIKYFNTQIYALHVSDNFSTNNDQHLPLGMGKINWTDFVKALNEIKYNNIFTLEVHYPKNDTLSPSERLTEMYKTTTELINKR